MTNDVQSHSDTDPKTMVDSDNQDTIDDPDRLLSKSRLISEQGNDPELAHLFKLVLPPVYLDKIPVFYYETVCLCNSGVHQMSLHLRNGQ